MKTALTIAAVLAALTLLPSAASAQQPRGLRATVLTGTYGAYCKPEAMSAGAYDFLIAFVDTFPAADVRAAQQWIKTEVEAGLDQFCRMGDEVVGNAGLALANQAARKAGYR